MIERIGLDEMVVGERTGVAGTRLDAQSQSPRIPTCHSPNPPSPLYSNGRYVLATNLVSCHKVCTRTCPQDPEYAHSLQGLELLLNLHIRKLISRSCGLGRVPSKRRQNGEMVQLRTHRLHLLTSRTREGPHKRPSVHLESVVSTAKGYNG